QTDDETAAQNTWKVMPKTRRLLARHGATFGGYIVTTAECCPSRASLITGQYAHNHGVFSSGKGEGYPKLIDKGNVLPVWLQDAGYNTIHVGKFMNHYTQDLPNRTDVAPGWDDWQTTLSGVRYYNYSLSANGKLVKYGDQDSDYVTRVLTHKSVAAVRKYAPERKPFYLQVDQRAPHTAAGNRPGRCGGGRRTIDEPVANIDLAPTILDLAGGRPCTPEGQCRTMDGRSLMPLLTGKGFWPNARNLLIEFRSPTPERHKTCNFAGIRTAR